MARKPKYDTEMLIFFLEEYVKQNGMTLIRATDVVRFCKEELGYSDVSYQMFTRNNQEAKQWINTFNENLKARRVNEDEQSVLKDGLIDIEFFMSQYQMSEEVKQELIRINRQIAVLSDEAQHAIELYKQTIKENERIKKELSVVKKKLKIMLSNNKELQNENKILKTYKKNVNRYMKEFVYDPVILSHFQEIGIILKDKKIIIPTLNKSMIDNSDDLKNIIDEMYRENSNGEDLEENKTDIITEKTDDWIKRFDEL